MGSYEVGGLTVEVVEGDITGADTDAISNAANGHLWMLFGLEAHDAFDAVARGKWGA